MISHEKILGILEGRYDYYSARVVLRDALETARLEEKKSYLPEEVVKIADAISKVGDRVEVVIQRLREFEVPQKAEKEVAPSEEKKAEKEVAPSEEKKVEEIEDTEKPGVVKKGKKK